MRDTCFQALTELARADERIVFVGSDLGAGVLEEFRREMPSRFHMEGVSEQNVVSLAAGLAMEGNVVYVNTIATFLTRRAYEQTALDLCLPAASVRLIGQGGGLVYGPLGPTHLAVEDLAILRALPNMTILAPADRGELRRMMPATVDWPGPLYLRLAKGRGEDVTPDGAPFVIGQAVAMRQGSDALVCTTGITLPMALAAGDVLAGEGIEIAVLHLPTVKPMDAAAVLAAADAVPAIVTVEEHTLIGGLGSAVAELIAEAGFDSPKRLRRIALPDAFADRYGSQESLLTHYGVTPARIADTVREMI